MDFAEAVTRAKLWTTSNSHGVTVSSTEENERRIVLRHQRGSFFITVPHNAGQDEWVGLDFRPLPLDMIIFLLIGCVE